MDKQQRKGAAGKKAAGKLPKARRTRSGNTKQLDFDSDSSGDGTSPQQTPPPRFSVGDAVEANWQGEGEYHMANITAFGEDGTFSLVYAEDGASEDGVPADYIREQQRTRRRAARAPANKNKQKTKQKVKRPGTPVARSRMSESPELGIQSEPQLEVAEVLDKNEKGEYLVRWKNFPDGDDNPSFEPLENLGDFGAKLARAFDAARAAEDSAEDAGGIVDETPKIAKATSRQRRQEPSPSPRPVLAQGARRVQTKSIASHPAPQPKTKDDIDVIMRSATSTTISMQGPDKNFKVLNVGQPATREAVTNHITALLNNVASEEAAIREVELKKKHSAAMKAQEVRLEAIHQANLQLKLADLKQEILAAADEDKTAAIQAAILNTTQQLEAKASEDKDAALRAAAAAANTTREAELAKLKATLEEQGELEKVDMAAKLMLRTKAEANDKMQKELKEYQEQHAAAHSASAAQEKDEAVREATEAAKKEAAEATTAALQEQHEQLDASHQAILQLKLADLKQEILAEANKDKAAAIKDAVYTTTQQLEAKASEDKDVALRAAAAAASTTLQAELTKQKCNIVQELEASNEAAIKEKELEAKERFNSMLVTEKQTLADSMNATAAQEKDEAVRKATEAAQKEADEATTTALQEQHEQLDASHQANLDLKLADLKQEILAAANKDKAAAIKDAVYTTTQQLEAKASEDKDAALRAAAAAASTTLQAELTKQKCNIVQELEASNEAAMKEKELEAKERFNSMLVTEKQTLADSMNIAAAQKEDEAVREARADEVDKLNRDHKAALQQLQQENLDLKLVQTSHIDQVNRQEMLYLEKMESALEQQEQKLKQKDVALEKADAMTKALIEEAEKLKLKIQMQEQQIRADIFEKENARPPPPSPANSAKSLRDRLNAVKTPVPEPSPGSTTSDECL